MPLDHWLTFPFYYILSLLFNAWVHSFGLMNGLNLFFIFFRILGILTQTHTKGERRRFLNSLSLTHKYFFLGLSI